MSERKKKHVIKFVRGSISILLSFLLTGVLSLSALLVEVNRYQDAKQQIEEASVNSALSLLAFFDSDLESRYGLYGIDSETISTDTFLNYLLFNSDGNDSDVYGGNNFSKLYNVTSGEFELKYDLANYQVLKRQLLEYEKYRTPLNIASEMLDVDKMIKELKKNIEKAIPGLENMLKICDSIADIAEALKALYCLYKDVEQLQLTINSSGNNSVGETLNDWSGQVWEAVEGLFSDEDWPSHDPSYIQAYNAFKDEVNGKVEYMKTTPSPPDPGPKPTTDVDGLYTTYQNALNSYNDAALLFNLIDAAKTLGFSDSIGIVDATKKISDLLDKNATKKDISKDDLQKLNLTENNTRRDFFEKINDKVGSVLGSGNKLAEYTEESLTTALTGLSVKVNSLHADMQNKNNDYNAANNELNLWNAKNEAYKAYNQKLVEYNEGINATKSALLEVIGVVAGELSSYKSSITKVSSSLDKASEALNTIDEVNKGFHSTEEDSEPDIFSEIKAQFIIGQEEKPDKGLAFLNSQRDRLNSLTAENINASYNFNNEFNTGDLLHDSSYYMTKSEVTAYCFMLSTFNLIKDMAKLIDIFKAMWQLVKVIQPFPSTYNWDCVVTLNPSTTDLLPSRINGGAGTTESSNQNDISDIEAMLAEAKGMLGSAYQNDINAVDPNIRLEEAELTAEVSTRISRLSSNLSKLATGGTTSNLLENTNWLLIPTVFSLLEIVPTLVEIIDDLIFIAQHIGDAIQILLNSLGENFLLNQYSIDMFPNRTTDKDGNKHNNEISGWSGELRTYFPDNSKAVQTFSGAQVEYVIGGSNSEIENQQKCFWSIFAIRALNNIFGVIMDPIAMELISACNIAAPLVFILWVYLESNIDMNMLVSGMEVPLIKTQIILSPQTLMDNVDKICTAFEDIDEEKAKEQELSYAAMKIDNITKQLLDVNGFFKMKYENYLWFFLFFTPNQTKVMRIADLIQMEMRYKKYSQGTSFELKNLHTYVRCQAEGTFNSILPVISLSDNDINSRGFKVRCVKYVGY